MGTRGGIGFAGCSSGNMLTNRRQRNARTSSTARLRVSKRGVLRFKDRESKTMEGTAGPDFCPANRGE
jgi:hypothetical protein